MIANEIEITEMIASNDWEEMKQEDDVTWIAYISKKISKLPKSL